MIKRHLPSLTALATFEAAARLLSFKAAASELNVTPAAVSRQIRNLEEDMGAPLFQRLHRQVRLTSAGEVLFESVASGFGTIAAAADSIRRSPAGRRLTVGSTNAVAAFWLLPRLKRFWERHPDINVDHVISDAPIDLKAEQVDLCIRFGRGAWSDLENRFLYADRVYPVCAPGFLEQHPTPTSVADLPEHPLLDVRVSQGWLDWTAWLRYHGVHGRIPRSRYFNNYVIAVQAAVDGQGIALGWNSMVDAFVADGRLVQPLPETMPSPGAYFLSYPEDIKLKPEVLLFADWLQQEAALT